MEKKSGGWKVILVIVLLVAIILGVDYKTTHTTLNPEMTEIRSEDDGIVFTWNKISGVKEYEIIRRKTKTGVGEVVATIDGSKDTYKLPVDKTKSYFYQVAYEKGSLTIGSYIRSASNKKTTLLEAVKTDEGVSFSWKTKKKVNKKVTYLVFRKKKGDKDFKQIAEVDPESSITTYVDTEVKKGTYIYTVQRVKHWKLCTYYGNYDKEGLSVTL